MSERDTDRYRRVGSDGRIRTDDRGFAHSHVRAVTYRSGISKIVPGLYVGSKPPPGRHDGIDVIVLAAMEYQPPASLFSGAEVIYAPLDDAPTRPMRKDEIALATKTATRVVRRLRAGLSVLVTCQLGMNRSALIAALAMHEVHGMSADEIIAILRRARGTWALSNPNFERLIRVVTSS